MLTSEEKNKRQQLPLYRCFKPPFAAVLFSGDNYW
jgi:hypothetical protein